MGEKEGGKELSGLDKVISDRMAKADTLWGSISDEKSAEDSELLVNLMGGSFALLQTAYGLGFTRGIEVKNETG